MVSEGKIGFIAAAIPILLLLCIIVSPALGETEIDLSAGDWTWKDGAISSFQGTIISDMDMADAVLTLSVKTRLDHSGEAVFTALNGKKVKIRKQAPTIETDLVQGCEIPFEAEWTVPEDTNGGIGWAKIYLTITSPEGTEIAAGALEVGSRTEEESLVASSPDRLSQRILAWLLIASASVWILAMTRFILLNRNRKDL